MEWRTRVSQMTSSRDRGAVRSVVWTSPQRPLKNKMMSLRRRITPRRRAGGVTGGAAEEAARPIGGKVPLAGSLNQDAEGRAACSVDVIDQRDDLPHPVVGGGRDGQVAGFELTVPVGDGRLQPRANCSESALEETNRQSRRGRGDVDKLGNPTTSTLRNYTARNLATETSMFKASSLATRFPTTSTASPVM